MVPKVSVITVVYNDAKHIASTIESVLSQTYPNLEYIIIDGNSLDGTKEIIQSYLNSKSFPHTITQFVSEKDNGIYEAMNKGIDLATGEWCNFMNSGDTFYQNTTIEEAFQKYLAINQSMGGGDINVIYGDSKVIMDNNHSKIAYAKSTNHKYSHRFIHQSAFIDTLVMKKYRYDTSFKIAGDTDFFTKIYSKGYVFQKLDLIVSCFNTQGISGRPSHQMFKEIIRVGYKHNKFFPIYFTIRYFGITLPKFFIKTLFLKGLQNMFKNISKEKK